MRPCGSKAPPAMLSLPNLTHVYANGVHAIDDVTLDILAGMYGTPGPNGAGKSSLMRCLATVQVPTAGSVRFWEAACAPALPHCA
jgi:ABC-2 type transport system ATP-binding protein